MIEFDKRDKEIQYQEWKEKNGEFVERLTKEVLDKYGKEFVEKSVINYFNKLNPKALSDILYSGLYNEIQEIVKSMVGYYGSSGYQKTNDWYGLKTKYY